MTSIGGLRGGPWRGLLAAGVAVLALNTGLARPAGAATRFAATTGNDSSNTCLSSGAPCKTITHALTQAIANDTVSVAAGTYNLALGETFPLTINKNLTLTGAGAGNAILDATGANQRVITISSGTVTIAWVTIMGGATSCTTSGSDPCSADGAGIRNFGTLTLTNSTVSGNTASCTASGPGCSAEGGGLSNGFLGSTLTLTASSVSGNTVSCTSIGDVSSACGAEGAGLYNEGTLTLTASTVSGNTASCTASGSGFCGAEAGGIYSHHDTTLVITNSTLSGNTATCTNSGSGSCSALGGGLTNNEGTLILTNSTVSGNTASCSASGSGHCGAQGGGLWLEGTLTLTNSTVSGNTASCSGAACNAAGGGLLLPFDTLNLTNSTVSGNTASCSGAGCTAVGGGLTNRSDATLTLTNSTVSGNTISCSGAGCTAVGGGLINVSGTVTLQNTIVAKQLAGPDCAGLITSNGFNLASDNTCHLTQPSDKPNVTNPLLGPLQNNGGPTQTLALLSGSPAIDAGTNTGCPPTDQRGFVRPVDGDGNGSALCDIGAYEVVPAIAAAVAASILPSGRSVEVGVAASAFATILNAGPATALGCRPAPVTPLPATFSYQTTDPATNVLTGTANTPVDIPPGGGQSFVFAFTPTSPFAPTDVQLTFGCTTTAPAPIFSGLNTLLLSASATPVPDIIALAATAGNTGIVTLASVGAFAVATVNVGAGAQIIASADTGSASLPVSLALCQTDPGTGACLAPPTPSVTTQINAGATPTFGVFVTGSGPVPFDPATNRIVVRFTDSGNVVRGATSVAVQGP